MVDLQWPPFYYEDITKDKDEFEPGWRGCIVEKIANPMSGEKYPCGHGLPKGLWTLF